MKPLRTGLGVGLLAGGVGAAAKLYQEWRSGASDGPARVVTGNSASSSARKVTASKVVNRTLAPGSGSGSKSGAQSGGKAAFTARRAARRAEANRPPWVVATVPGSTTHVPAPTRPAPTAPRKAPSVVARNPVSAKTVGASVGKFAAKRAGKAIGKVAAERVGKAIEIIEVLEKVVASVTEAAPAHDMTPAGPGATGDTPLTPAILVPLPGRPRPSADASPTDAPRGTRVSVRKFERGPKVVVGPAVRPSPSSAPAPVDAPTEEAPTEQGAEPPVEPEVEATVDAAVDAVEAAVEAAAGSTEATPAPRTRKPRSTKAASKEPAKATSPKRRPPKAPAPPKRERTKPAPVSGDGAASTDNGSGPPGDQLT